jgi:hypothetical protein
MKTQPIIVTTQKELIETTLKFLYYSISYCNSPGSLSKYSESLSLAHSPHIRCILLFAISVLLPGLDGPSRARRAHPDRLHLVSFHLL